MFANLGDDPSAVSTYHSVDLVNIFMLTFGLFVELGRCLSSSIGAVLAPQSPHGESRFHTHTFREIGTNPDRIFVDFLLVRGGSDHITPYKGIYEWDHLLLSRSYTKTPLSIGISLATKLLGVMDRYTQNVTFGFRTCTHDGSMGLVYLSPHLPNKNQPFMDR